MERARSNSFHPRVQQGIPPQASDPSSLSPVTARLHRAPPSLLALVAAPHRRRPLKRRPTRRRTRQTAAGLRAEADRMLLAAAAAAGPEGERMAAAARRAFVAAAAAGDVRV